MKNKIIQELSEQGFRITIVRKKIIEFFVDAKQPLTACQIIELFKKEKIKVHRATIYREIEFFLNHDILHSLNLGQDASSYELNELHHHHYFVCKKCGSVIEIIPDKVEEALEKYEEYFKRKEKVQVDSHSLKIFGLCAGCKKN